MAAYGRGDLRFAEDQAKRFLSLVPGDASATVLVALICARTGRKSAAVAYLQNALRKEPQCYEAHIALSTLLFGQSKGDEAIYHAERAIELRPHDVDSYRHFANDLVMHGMLDRAVSVLLRAIEVTPDDVAVLQDLAATLSDMGRVRESAAAWERLLGIEPTLLVGWLKLGGIYLAISQFDGAVRCGRKAVDLNEESSDARILLALSLSETGGAREAETHLRRAIELKPDEYIAYAALGLSLQEQGRFDEAELFFEKTIEICPTNGQAYYSILRSRKATSADARLLQTVEERSQDESLGDLDRSYLQYALGKASEDLGEFERAMGHYDLATESAARHWFGDRPADHAWYSAMIDSTIGAFTSDRLAALRAKGLASEKPLLIVGMMRSGTTLIEQIVSSHPDVHAGGELTYWHDHAGKVFQPATGEIDEGLLIDVASRYVEMLANLGGEAQRVTDKLPHNYAMLGFVQAAIPNAKVIHVRRNPIDNCLSIYTTAFNRPPEFALVRENIVYLYRQYERIMAHWRATLPPDRLLEVDYESLIANREAETRRIIEFVGLEWNDACLHHERNERNVNTPSVWQVRQPIYNTSVDRWKRFEPWLGEFRSLLPT